MNYLNPLLRCTVALLVFCSPSYAWLPPHRSAKPLVQMAILLDTSNSMDGLIEQAKTQLWRIANDLAYSSRYGERPTLQIALYEYGNDSLSPRKNWVRQVLPFTTDMDLVSEKLFSLRTNGGQEYCGTVIKDALNELNWDTSREVYKVIFIAGNEPFTQGPVYYGDSVARAARHNVTVNTIYCGTYADGVQTQWYNGAMAGRGAYLTIDQNRAVVVDPTPYDDEISQLGRQISDTYVGYGEEGQAAKTKQIRLDKLAEAQPKSGAATERAIFKASSQYAAAAPWDAVGKVASGKVNVSQLEKTSLPQELQSKSEGELAAYFKDQQSKRTTLENRLTELKKSREDFLVKKQAPPVPGSPSSLDQAMRNALRGQAGKFHFTFGAAR